MHAFYNSVSVMICPYVSEGYNTVCLEAISQSIPVFATYIPGCREVLGDAGIYTGVDGKLPGIKAARTAWKRWEEVKVLNDIGELLKFIA
jgi:glycosyltransferase involved in cell wall biosynthesis